MRLRLPSPSLTEEELEVLNRCLTGLQLTPETLSDWFEEITSWMRHRDRVSEGMAERMTVSIAIRWQPVGIDRWLQASRVKSSELSGGSHPRTLRACSMSLQRQRLLEIASKISKRRLAGASRHFSMMPTQSRWLSSRGNGAPAWDGWCPGPHPDGCTGQRAISSATRGARGSRQANGRR